MKFALLYPPLRQARELSRGNRFNHTASIIIQTTMSETGMLLCYELANYFDITVTESKSFRRRRLRCSCQNGRPALSSWKMELLRRSATRCRIYGGGLTAIVTDTQVMTTAQDILRHLPYIPKKVYTTTCCGPRQLSVQLLATSFTVRASNPCRGEIFRTRPNRSWGPPTFLYNE